MQLLNEFGVDVQFECGRTDLSRQVAEITPALEFLNYMSLIRAAGSDKDVVRAFKVSNA